MHNNTSWLNLTDAVCVVTGAAGGIGAAIARAFAAQGARLALLDRDLGACQVLAAELAETGGQAIALACDIADPASVAAARDAVEARFGRADVLVNNASILRPGALADLDLALWNQLLAVNLTGYLACAQAFGALMRQHGGGSLVHIASIAAHAPQPHSGAYSAAKAGVSMLSRQLAVEWGAEGIRSNVVCPGMIRTPLSAAFYSDPAVERARCGFIASGRIGEPQDIAEAVLFLASERASYVNGAELTVDGGFESMGMAVVPRPGFEGARP